MGSRPRRRTRPRRSFADRFETADLSCWSAVDNGSGAVAADGPAVGCGGRGWTLERDYVYAGSRLLAAETSSGRQHFTLDHLGSPRLVTGEGGETLARHVYYPYGEEITVGSEERLKFTGHERDLGGSGTADDLDYMHARYYQPGLGRFLSVDPVRSADPVLPQSWNRYAYVRGNPVYFVDPDGREIKIYQGGIVIDHGPFGDRILYWGGDAEEWVENYRKKHTVKGVMTQMAVLMAIFTINDDSAGDGSDPDDLDPGVYAPRNGSRDERVDEATQPGRGKGANRRDRKQVDDAARAEDVDRREFGDYVESVKESEQRRGDENFTYEELLELAREYKSLKGRK